MAGIELKHEIRDQITSDVLRQIERNMGSTRPALLEIGEHLQGSVEERFRTETDPQGRPWEPLTDFTKANKRGNQILTESGGAGLRGSIHYRVGSDFEQGTNSHLWRHPPTGRYHQGQARRRPGHRPPRWRLRRGQAGDHPGPRIPGPVGDGSRGDRPDPAAPCPAPGCASALTALKAPVSVFLACGHDGTRKFF